MWSPVSVRLLSVVLVFVCHLQPYTAEQSEGRNFMFPIYNEPENFYQNYHNHSHGFGHAGHREEREVIHFEGPISGRPSHRHPPHRSPPSGSAEVPLDFLKQLNELENISDFFPFIEGGAENFTDAQAFIANRFGEENDERKAVVNAKPANCMPEERTISLLEETNDPSVIYIPSCTRVKRCGGCCSSGIMSCQPVETEMINLRIYATQYNGNNQLKMTNKKIVSVEQHTKCKCDCIIKAKDCNLRQEYRPGECRCACTNVDEREKCNAESSRKIWDHNNCVCACRTTQQCSTGLLFNPTTCRCTPIPDRMIRRNVGTGESEKRRNGSKRQKIQPRPVVPLTPINTDQDTN